MSTTSPATPIGGSAKKIPWATTRDSTTCRKATTHQGVITWQMYRLESICQRQRQTHLRKRIARPAERQHDFAFVWRLLLAGNEEQEGIAHVHTSQVPKLATRFRLADGREGFATKALEKPDDFYKAGADIPPGTRLAGRKLSDEEATANGLKWSGSNETGDNPPSATPRIPSSMYWATFGPGDLLLETTSIHSAVVRLQDIVAIKPNGGEWIEDRRGEP